MPCNRSSPIRGLTSEAGDGDGQARVLQRAGSAALDSEPLDPSIARYVRRDRERKVTANLAGDGPRARETNPRRLLGLVRDFSLGRAVDSCTAHGRASGGWLTRPYPSCPPSLSHACGGRTDAAIWIAAS
jgi:hypothetical protein